MADKQYLITSKLNKQEFFNVILQNPENKNTGQEYYFTKDKLTYLYDKIDLLESYSYRLIFPILFKSCPK